MSEISDLNEILMTAILSMDVYNRDDSNSSKEIYDTLMNNGGKLGGASLILTNYNNNTLFGAAAWFYDGQIIIAYRGTVTASRQAFLTELIHPRGGSRDSLDLPKQRYHGT